MNFAPWARQSRLAVAPVVVVVSVAVGPNSVSAQAAPEAPTSEELQRAILQRDTIIEDLVQHVVNLNRRVEELERRLGPAAEQPPTTAAAPAIPQPKSATVPPAAAGKDPPPPVEEAVAEEAVPPAEAEVAAPAPGEFEVDEEAIERALARALIQTGALLLPPGTAEVEPSFSYVRRESDAPQLIVEGEGIIVASNELTRNELEAELILRLGLPFDSQVEVEMPYSYEEVDNAERVDFAVRREDERSAAGVGDVSVSFAKGLLREEGLLPNLIARVQWDGDTGESEGNVSLGSGFHELTSSLTATKRQDPLVFVGSAFYTTSLEDDNIDPGDQLGFSLGTVLAASPETSLRFFLSQSFSRELEVGGQNLEGSDQVSSSLILGASSIIAPRVLLDVTVGVGLTEDAPDYSINVSVPIAFDLPFRF